MKILTKKDIWQSAWAISSGFAIGEILYHIFTDGHGGVAFGMAIGTLVFAYTLSRKVT